MIVKFGRALTVLGLLAVVSLGGCEVRDPGIVGPGNDPAPPRNVGATYYDRAVTVTWDLDPAWAGESFRVYGKRVTDQAFFRVAEVTSCIDGSCRYVDLNIVAGARYEFYVAAVSADGIETPSDVSVEVDVPHPIAPPTPGGLDVVPLDGAVYLRWNDHSRAASDFAFYRVYLQGANGSGTFLLGETDSEGFLDLLAENGTTYAYFVSAVDEFGHESQGSTLVQGTPRPDFHGELVYAWDDQPDLSGFRFQEDESLNPIVPGNSVNRHFRIESDVDGWWLVPAPGVEVHREAYLTTAIRCGPGSDATCTELSEAPASNYSGEDLGLLPGLTYVVRVPAGGGLWRYGALRVSHVGWAQEGAIVIFDWAYQLQVGNVALAPVSGSGARGGRD
jgi:hypothetical protein